MSTRFFIHLPDPTAARGSDAALAFSAKGAEAFADQLQSALRSDALYQKWKASQPQNEDDDEGSDDDQREDPMAAVDPSASVSGESRDLGIDLEANTTLGGSVLKQRLRILAGSHWQLRDVRAG